MIIKCIGPFGKDGQNLNKTRVLVICDFCGSENETRFERVRDKDRYVCHPCGTAFSKSYMIYPKDILGNEGVIDVDLDTLGILRQVVDKSKILRRCKCGNEDWVQYGHHRRKKNKLCHSCSAIKAMTDERKKQISKIVTSAWQDEETRRKMLENRHEVGYLTSPHQKLKDLMTDNNMAGFDSEWWVCNYKYRVDELDRSNKLIVEMFGDFYHANPSQYAPDEVLNLPGGQKMAQDVWSNDLNRILEIEQNGYSVFIAWENDVLNNPDQVMSNLLDWYKEKIN